MLNVSEDDIWENLIWIRQERLGSVLLTHYAKRTVFETWGNAEYTPKMSSNESESRAGCFLSASFTGECKFYLVRTESVGQSIKAKIWLTSLHQ